MISNSGHNTLKRGHRIMRVDLGAASTRDLRYLGIGANHRYRRESLMLTWQDLLFVLEQDDALGSRFTHQSATLRQINGLLWDGLRVLKEARFVQQQQQATHARFNRRFRDLTPLDGFEQLLAAPAWTRHLQIEPGIDGSGGTLDRFKPVRQHPSVKAPLVLLNLG